MEAYKYFSYGESLAGHDVSVFVYQQSKDLHSACLMHPNVDVVELRCIRNLDGIEAEIIVIDVLNGSVPSRNPHGIQLQERLALVYRPHALIIPYEVRVLRKDFPVTIHQNQVPVGEPLSLCLYVEQWCDVERKWTPQLHLKRIFEWIRDAAKDSLHHHDQPLERLFFDSQYSIILPSNFPNMELPSGKELRFVMVNDANHKKACIRGIVCDKNRSIGGSPVDMLLVEVPPVVHGAIERFPLTLGELNQQLIKRESGLFDFLNQKIQQSMQGGTGLNLSEPRNSLFLVLKVPMLRSDDETPEVINLFGYLVDGDLGKLGLAIGALFQDPNNKNMAYVNRDVSMHDTPSDAVSRNEAGHWQSIKILPVNIYHEMTLAGMRQASGITVDESDFHGVLAGVGALGSALAEIWSKEAWGKWVFIDNDIMMPHNIIRHTGKNPEIGMLKVNIVNTLSGMNLPEESAMYSAIDAQIGADSNEMISESLKQAACIIDATTSIPAQRELALSDDAPRAATVFLTPTGMSSVLLMEDEDRSIRLSSLEAQYYRAILQNIWGEKHLNGYNNGYSFGVGCREISNILSYEHVLLHASILARQIRLRLDCPDPAIVVWESNELNGGVNAFEVDVHSVMKTNQGGWIIIWDEALHGKLISMRASCLPNETGGVLIGYFDQKDKCIYIVDVMSAPADSASSPSGFIRGVEGLLDEINAVKQRTANMVNYVGEWHSHPDGVASIPSPTDISLRSKLSLITMKDGLPFLMAVVGEDGVSFSLEPLAKQ